MGSRYDDDKTIPLWGPTGPAANTYPTKRVSREIVLENIKTLERYTCSSDFIMTLGRDSDYATLQLTTNDLYMSKLHMKLFIEGDRLYAEDMSSTNGSYVNNQRIYSRVELFVDDILKLGHSEFRIVRFD